MKIGFIGASGNMASAIISGILKSGYESEKNLNLFDISTDKLKSYKDAVLCESAADVVKMSDYIFLAVKPQILFSVISEIKNEITDKKVLVSIAAGISIDSIKQAVGFDCKVVRVMPNTPLMLSEGASGVAFLPPVEKSEFEYVLGAFKTAGIAVAVDEDKINAVTAVSGSGPAYVFKFAKAVVDGAAELGLDEDVASALMFQTLIGAATMLKDSGKTPQELIDMVTSPKGTTLAALESFDADNFDEIVKKAVKACHDRAVELGKKE